ncbi:MAG: Bug family tripartite tricarboxylate transporter substrate binding protein [Rhizomicrobium sp.]
MTQFSRRNVLAGAAGLVAMPRIATAQDAWPSREIHAICGFPPGTGADIFVRCYAKKFQDAIGKTVIVENKPGAFGNISTEYVAKSKPDGYTLFIAPGSSFLAASPALFKKLSFDPVNDFEHVTTLAKNTFILAVAGDGPFKTVPALVADLREKGNKASYGSLANSGLVASELFKAHFGLATVEVKYKETTGALNDLWSDNLAFIHIDPTSGAAHFKSGKRLPLATASAERFAAFSDIPSAKEAGIDNSNLVGWWSVHMPKGTPQPILAKLETAFNQIAVSDETKDFLMKFGGDPFLGNSKMLKELLISDTKAWAGYVKVAKIEPLS